MWKSRYAACLQFNLFAVGTEFWKCICLEHGIKFDGTTTGQNLNDRKDVFFYQVLSFLPTVIG